MASFHDIELPIFSKSNCRSIVSSAKMSFQPTNKSSLSLGSSGSQTGAGFRQLAIHTLDQAHQDTVRSAIARILDTDIAEITYAQIIDGLPLGEVAFESRGGIPHSDHPINHCHDELCTGILEKAREFRSRFDPLVLKFDSRVSADSQSLASIVITNYLVASFCSHTKLPLQGHDPSIHVSSR